METLFGKEPISSVSFSQREIISNIMELYNIERFDVDCTYSIGNIWKGLPSPIHKFDIAVKRKGVVMADSENLPLNDNSVSSIMYDPPFIIGDKDEKTKSRIIKRFSSYENFEQLKKNYFNSLIEFYRILKQKGIVVFKCQDIVHSGNQHITHYVIIDMAVKIGFTPEDIFIFINRQRINLYGSKWKNQRHARKNHTYFLVLQKKRCVVDYSF